PSRGLFALTIPDMDPRLAAAMARAYNDWLYEFCQENPERLLGAGMISPFDVNDAVAETRRCVREFGFRAMFLRPNEVNGRNWHDPYYEPLWATLEELGVPLGFHEGSGSQLRQVGEQFGANTMLKHIYSHPVEQMLTAGAFCAGGILENHPRLRVAFLEGNCSWVPFLLWRMDEHWEWLGDVYARELTMAPSAYFKRQCFVSVECDEEPVKHVIDAIGDDRIEPRFKDRAPRMERMETPTGRKYDAWFIDGQQVGTLGAVMQAGQRFEDPSQIDFLGMWEDVRLGAYEPQAMIKENEMDGVW